MILSSTVMIKINKSNIEHYEKMGYEACIGDVLIVPVALLSKWSHYEILCKCDVCGKEKYVKYKDYMRYDNEWGYYYCRGCSENKRKRSLIMNAGVEYPNQDKTIRDKMVESLKKTLEKRKTPE